MDYSLILIDDPAPMVRRITLNRPEKRNALNATLRREILTATREADRDASVRVTIIRGAGKCFSAGYDLSGDPNAQGEPLDYNAEGEGSYMRGVTNGWMSIWDLAKPVIAQVHGYCLAGGSELATGCDLVYVAEDAKIGYPAVRFGVPDMHLDAEVLAGPQRIALLPSDIVQLNKRTVHRAMDIMGLRSAIRSGTELCA